jgi:type I restriction enzyme R subunit
MMLAMATAPGNVSYSGANLSFAGIKARPPKFLVDRRALAARAIREFNAFNTPKGKVQSGVRGSQRFQREDFARTYHLIQSFEQVLTNQGCSHVCLCLYYPTDGPKSIGAEGSFGQFGDADVEDDADRQNIPIHALI